ncbi:MAG: hypothetical protein ACRDHZ_15695 [Ktedonobacteraceae bacterium]
MDVTAWSNGLRHSKGAGYGIKVSAEDRDANFNRSWKLIFVSLPGSSSEVAVNIDKPSFWGQTCRELISRDIGAWLIANKYAPWVPGAPPKFRLYSKGDGYFRLEVT